MKRFLNSAKKILNKKPFRRLNYILDFSRKATEDFIIRTARKEIKSGSRILDAGAGSVKYKKFFPDCIYKTQDFKQYGGIDYVSDIVDIPVQEKSFDIIICTEVLEHLPFADFEIALKEMKRVSQEYVVISLPHSSIFFSLTAIFPFIRTVFKKRYFNFFIKIPQFFRLNQYDGQHYWEMGRRGTSKNKIKIILKKYFEIEKEFQPFLNFYHYFFILKIKE